MKTDNFIWRYLLRICFITSSYPRYKGDATSPFVHESARHLVMLGHKVWVVTPHYPGAKRCELMDGVSVHRFRYFMPASQQRLGAYGAMYTSIEQQPSVIFQAILYVWFMVIEALKVCKRQDIEIVVSFWAFPQGLAGIVIKKMLGLPFVVRLNAVEISLSLSKYTFIIPFLKSILTNADLVIPNSTYTKNLMYELKALTRNVLTIREGTDIERFNLSISGNNVKLSYNLGNKFLLLTVARLVERKGIEYLIYAMKYVLSKHPECVLIVIGEGPLKQKLMELAKGLGIEKNIIFISKVSDKALPYYYAAADVFVLPSIAEALGVVLLEAMATGKPVIASRVGGIPEVAIDGKTGILVPKKSPQALSNAIISLMEDRNTLQMLGRNARFHIIEKFSWTRIAKEFEEALIQFLSFSKDKNPTGEKGKQQSKKDSRQSF